MTLVLVMVAACSPTGRQPVFPAWRDCEPFMFKPLIITCD